MPELPEVETTTRGLRKELVGCKILDVWTDLNTKDKRKVDTISNPSYFPFFKKEIKNNKILSVERRAKNILINLSGSKTILIHLKMTGHLLYGKYKFIKNENKWIVNEKGPLNDPYNRFVHVVFTLSNKKFLVFSDARKFGKITIFETNTTNNRHLNNLGPEPLDKKFTYAKFKKRIKRKLKSKAKNVLMDQSILVGIGNIYSDEILWHSNVKPDRKIFSLTEKELKLIYNSTKKLLNKGIDFGGDSMSDYRNIYGLPGKFQMHHMAYRRTNERCKKKGCNGVIIRKIINNRSAHYCSQHQI